VSGAASSRFNCENQPGVATAPLPHRTPSAVIGDRDDENGSGAFDRSLLYSYRMAMPGAPLTKSFPKFGTMDIGRLIVKLGENV